MRIVFIGAVELSLHILERLVELDAEVVGICTLLKSRLNSDHRDLSGFGACHGIPSVHVNDINSIEILKWIQDKSPDIIFCIGWSTLIKQNLLKLAPRGIIGYHPAALPANRGRHPLIWALVLGLKKTASTFFFMDEGADTGDILSQKEIAITEQDDARSLYDKVLQTALNQMEEFLPQLAMNSFERIKQNDQIANVWRKRGPADGQIDWRMSAQSIHNLVRGLAKPYIGAHFMVDGAEIKVWKTRIVLEYTVNIEPGKVLLQKNGQLVVKCGVDALLLLDIDPELKVNLGTYL